MKKQWSLIERKWFYLAVRGAAFLNQRYQFCDGEIRPETPKNVFLFWAQGIDAAPDLVKRAVDSWFTLNPSWAIHVLDLGAVREWAELPRVEAFPRLQSYADLLRLELLKQHGGVWADATCLCSSPLDRWIPQVACTEQFFAFRGPSADRIVSNWFLYAGCNNQLIHAWADEFRKRVFNSSFFDDYFLAHHCFAKVLIGNARLRRDWLKTAKLGHVAPHSLSGLLASGASQNELEVALNAAPLHKLSTKVNYDVRCMNWLMSLS